MRLDGPKEPMTDSEVCDEVGCWCGPFNIEPGKRMPASEKTSDDTSLLLKVNLIKFNHK